MHFLPKLQVRKSIKASTSAASNIEMVQTNGFPSRSACSQKQLCHSVMRWSTLKSTRNGQRQYGLIADKRLSAQWPSALHRGVIHTAFLCEMWDCRMRPDNDRALAIRLDLKLYTPFTVLYAQYLSLVGTVLHTTTNNRVHVTAKVAYQRRFGCVYVHMHRGKPSALQPHAFKRSMHET